MTQIRLQRLGITNFRGIRELELKPQGGDLDIFGANGTGKSTVRNAFLWLLFGKDAQDRKDESIKRREGGKELHHTNVEVEATISVDGAEMTLRRIYAEVWRKPRGQAEQVFDGHETKYYIDDVPLTMRDYNGRIGEIVQEDIFKLITNPQAFLALGWERQRQILFDMAGTIDDAEIASRREEFAELLDRLSGKSFKDYKSQLSEKKRKLKKDLAEIQPRIDQTRKLMPTERDWDDLEGHLSDLESRIKRADELLADANNQTEAALEARRQRNEGLGRLQDQLQAAIQRELRKAQEEADQQNRGRAELERRFAEAQDEQLGLQRQYDRGEQLIKTKTEGIAKIQQTQADLREEWHRLNAESYPEYGQAMTCPHCGGIFEADQSHEERKAAWLARRESSMQRITSEGQRYNEQIEAIHREVDEQQNKLKELREAIDALARHTAELGAQLEATPLAAPRAVVAEDIEEVRTLQARIDELKAQATIAGPSVNTSEIQTQRRVWVEQRDTVKAQLGERTTIQKSLREIAKLEQEGKDLAEAIAKLEQDEYVMAQFSRERVTEFESRINSLFSMVRFQLFDTTISGDEFETCIPIVGNAPAATANTADVLNAGLDIINTLSRHYGVSAPIFLDNREGVTSIIDLEAQTINLYVSPKHPTLTTINNK